MNRFAFRTPAAMLLARSEEPAPLWMRLYALIVVNYSETWPQWSVGPASDGLSGLALLVRSQPARSATGKHRSSRREPARFIEDLTQWARHTNPGSLGIGPSGVQD